MGASIVRVREKIGDQRIIEKKNRMKRRVWGMRVFRERNGWEERGLYYVTGSGVIRLL